MRSAGELDRRWTGAAGVLYASRKLRINDQGAILTQPDIPLALQTAYADLLDRAAAAAFSDAFPQGGSFTPKSIRGRRYWYFQDPTANGRMQRYAGPETPELLDRIARHRQQCEDQRQRRAIVSMLIRSAHLPRPLPAIGEVVAALAQGGVFRLRGVLVGTVAYQTYAAMFGVRLPASMVQTADVDVAQFVEVSAAVRDHTPPMLEILRQSDPSFRPVPSLHDPLVFCYEAPSSGIRVEFLTPNRGLDTERPRPLPALGTDAQPLRFLDYLIRDPEPAVLLHGTGIYVSVPAPERFALHKLIVARRRRTSDAKQAKDLMQARSLLEVLVRKRPHELCTVWEEAWGRGRTWRQLLGEGLGLLHPPGIRDSVLKVVGATRSVVPGLDLVFAGGPNAYDGARDVVMFFGKAGPETVQCIATRDALTGFLGGRTSDGSAILSAFRENRAVLERAASAKYLHAPVDEPGAVVVTATDLEP